MKGFIEVTETDGTVALVNIQKIVWVSGSAILCTTETHKAFVINSTDSYEMLKAKISEATR